MAWLAGGNDGLLPGRTEYEGRADPTQDYATGLKQFEAIEDISIVAAPGSDAYGRLSVLVGWRAEARILFDIDPRAFVPPPKVVSSVVRLLPRRDPLPCDPALLQRVTAAAFGQRRKMLRQSLRGLTDPAPVLAAAGIEGTRRAEEIDVAGFVAIAHAIGEGAKS